MQRREIEASPSHFNHVQKQPVFSPMAGSRRASGRGGAPDDGEALTNNSLACKGGGRTSERARVPISGDDVCARKFDCTKRV